jgi:peptidoglycan/xylan/chitin deacetylase (PgdA/CDA1 family)
LTRLFLLRYDTEAGADRAEAMRGFFEKVVSVHRRHAIPATFFCTGRAIDVRERAFTDFFREVKDDPLFDIQDHSYLHVGVGYRDGKPVEVLRADYERSFAAHERVFGKRPFGVSICGTSGADGPRLAGFDETEKSRAEFDMLAALGMRMINAFLTGVDESKEFVGFERLAHPEIMGFPSSFSDTDWMRRRDHGDPVEYILASLRELAARDEHMPLMLHDWVAWLHAPNQELTHVVAFVDEARRLGYEPVTHAACYQNKPLWRAR